MAINADLLVSEIIGNRGLSEGNDSIAAVTQAINRAIVDLNTYAGQDIDELTLTGATIGSISISTSFGNALRRLIDYHLERMPFWKREERLVSEAERKFALGEARQVEGYHYAGPNLDYDSAE